MKEGKKPTVHIAARVYVFKIQNSSTTPAAVANIMTIRQHDKRSVDGERKGPKQGPFFSVFTYKKNYTQARLFGQSK